jgi:xanthine/CO dehydrogenase XdhC/CoxF family maturation factor
LLADLGADAEKLMKRLHAPVGLALGGRAPESIALAIVSEIHAFLYAGRISQGAQVPVHGGITASSQPRGMTRTA